MTDNSNNVAGISQPEENVGDSAVMTLKCDQCSFSNTDKGGMKRHTKAKHKPGAKRAHEEEIEGDDGDRDDKRPKIDDNFDPALASTQIEDEEEELDEFDAVLLAEENDYEETELSVKFSDETLARLGNETKFEFHNIEEEEMQTNDEIMKTVLEADLAILQAKIKSVENESNAKELTIEEHKNEINTLRNDILSCSMQITNLEQTIEEKDKTIETSLSRTNTLEYEAEQMNNKIRAFAKEKNEQSNRMKLLEKALRKQLKTTNPVPNGVADHDEVSNLKRSNKSKDAIIKEITTGKITLAKELKEAQKKVNGGDNATLEKCTKLTKDLKTKTTELKAVEKERKSIKVSTSNECNQQ